MHRTPAARPLLIDPAAPRRSARERAALRWFGPDRTPNPRAGRSRVEDPTARRHLAAA